jgi:D-glycero-alpha-D-manno-heptose-7-phosphate kinase
MIITRTPFRVSFFGGGSDLAAFYRRSPGAVLSTTIDKYMYLSAHPYFDGTSVHFKYSRSELVASAPLLQHPIARRVLELHPGAAAGIEITSTADVPAGTGLGSSSAFTVGLLHLVGAYLGRVVPPGRLAALASSIEIEDLGAPIGKQDQYASAYGGLNLIRFSADETVDVAPVVVKAEVRRRLHASLLMFFTGEQRDASRILATQKTALERQDDTHQTMCRMVELAHRAKGLLEEGDLEAFARLLDEAWTLKRSLTRDITSTVVDEMYARAQRAGAWGGKLLGAGGGGFLLVMAPPERHAAIREALAQSRELSVGLDRGGSKVVYMSEET